MSSKQLILKLRKETLAPFSACIQALADANYDFEEAKKLLFKQSILKTSTKNYDDELPEGKLLAVGIDDFSFAALIHLKAQTDFVTNSQPFLGLKDEIGNIVLQELSKRGEFSAAKISSAEILNWRSSKDNLSVEEKISSISSITKEKIKLGECWVSDKKEGHFTLSYTHYNRKLAVLLTLKSGSKKLTELDDREMSEVRRLVIHLAGADFLFLTKEDLTEEWKNKESEVLRENMLKKNPELKNVEQIIANQIIKKSSEVIFTEQSFVLDPSVKISSILSKYDLTPIWVKKISL